jgi:3-deoxy-D-manno-octulosonate 8-phosphate phosphatase KdsC-like HAD superfamily phosphatase
METTTSESIGTAVLTICAGDAGNDKPLMDASALMASSSSSRRQVSTAAAGNVETAGAGGASVVAAISVSFLDPEIL